MKTTGKLASTHTNVFCWNPFPPYLVFIHYLLTLFVMWMHQMIPLDLNSDKQAFCFTMLLIPNQDSQETGKNTSRNKALNLNNAHYKIMTSECQNIKVDSLHFLLQCQWGPLAKERIVYCIYKFESICEKVLCRLWKTLESAFLCFWGQVCYCRSLWLERVIWGQMPLSAGVGALLHITYVKLYNLTSNLHNANFNVI